MNLEEVFLYTDGDGKKRYGDPLALLRRLDCYSPDGDVNVLLDAADSRDEAERREGSARLGAAVCKVFHLGEPWNEETGQGVMEGTWRPLLERYLEQLAKETPAPEAKPDSAPPTDAPVTVGTEAAAAS